MTSPNTFNPKLNAQYNLHYKAILNPERNDKAIIIKHLQINNMILTKNCSLDFEKYHQNL